MIENCLLYVFRKLMADVINAFRDGNQSAFLNQSRNEFSKRTGVYRRKVSVQNLSDIQDGLRMVFAVMLNLAKSRFGFHVHILSKKIRDPMEFRSKNQTLLFRIIPVAPTFCYNSLEQKTTPR